MVGVSPSNFGSGRFTYCSGELGVRRPWSWVMRANWGVAREEVWVDVGVPGVGVEG